MLGYVTLATFVLSLTICIVFGVDLVNALIFGAILFYSYGAFTMKDAKRAFISMISGLNTIKNIIMIFLLIGCLTATWRFSGTIAYIIYRIVPIVDARYFLLYTFLLCSMMSMLMGTSIGSCASMGVVCMVISKYIGINPVYMGGAILSGIYVGDRTSPMSSSAALVAELTKTDIYINIKNMIKSGTSAFTVSCILYAFLGFGKGYATLIDFSVLDVFSDNFIMSPLLLLPAVLIIVLSLFRLDVRIVISASVITGCFISFLVQKTTPLDMLKMCVFGYKSAYPELAVYMDGGGIFSMIKAGLIVGISSTYFGIFKDTDILSGVKKLPESISDRFGRYFATLVCAVFTSAVACNQTLASMLTYRLTDTIHEDKYIHALDIENSAILVPAVIPWNIACAIPMVMAGFDIRSLVFAFFCILVPIRCMIKEFLQRRKTVQQKTR